jgi:hypothetical protein
MAASSVAVLDAHRLCDLAALTKLARGEDDKIAPMKLKNTEGVLYIIKLQPADSARCIVVRR